MNIEQIRNQFPILQRQVNGHSLVYLDNAATTQKPETVIDSEYNYYRGYNANIHRGVHSLSCEATSAYEQTRRRVAEFINAPMPERGVPQNIIFTSGTTESVNLLASSWGRDNVGVGDEIIVSIAEHHSNLVPWQMLAAENGAVIRYIPLREDGHLDYAAYEAMFTAKTVLVAVTLMSNVLGTVTDGRRIVEVAHSQNVPVFFDAAQAVAHCRIDVADLDCDFLAFSAHKVYGPTGVGVLYGKTEILSSLSPWKGGGEMINRVTEEGFTPAPLPYRFEAGTPNVAGVIGLGAALEFVTNTGIANIIKHEKILTAYVLKRLQEINEIVIYGGQDRAGVITFNLADVHSHDLTHFLDQKGVAARAGHHCAQPLMNYLGINASSRISFAAYNTFEEVDFFIETLKEAVSFFLI